MQSIKLPASAKDLRVKHFKALSNPLLLSDCPIFSLSDKCVFLSDFLGMDLSEVKVNMTRKQVDNIFNYVVSLFDNFKPSSNPPNEITMNGILMERINPEKVGVAWHMDWEERMKAPDNYIDIATMFYFPKGKIYGKLDENKNMIHPLKERRLWVESDMTLFTFIEAHAFFLRKYHRLMKRYILIEKSKNKAISSLQNIRGLKQ